MQVETWHGVEVILAPAQVAETRLLPFPADLLDPALVLIGYSDEHSRDVQVSPIENRSFIPSIAEALKALRQAVMDGYTNVLSLRTDTDLNALRERPEFQEIIEECERGLQLKVGRADERPA